MRRLFAAISARYRRMFPSKAPVIIVLAMLAAGVGVIIYAANNNDGPTEITPGYQVNSVISTSTAFRDIENPVNSQLPVTILPSTEYISMLSSTESTVTEASVNSALNTTAAVFTDAAGVSTIYATRLLPDQYEALLAGYEDAGAEVTVAATTGARTVTLPNGRSQTISSTGEPVGSSGPNLFLILGIVLVLVIAFGFWRRHMMMKQGGGPNGMGPAGRMNLDKKEIVDIPKTRFTDVAGCEEAVDELKEVVHYLKNPEKFTAMGARAAKGVLLVGSPGTGKTLLARAVAGEAGVPFYAVTGSDFTEMYVGVGAKRVRELFGKAKKHEDGCIIFIDEIDAAGRKRSASGNGSNQEQENTLNALLTELDGFEQNKIIVMGATNRPDILDEALTRPGRLEKKVTVSLPDRNGRVKILEVHSAGKPLDESVDFMLISRRTPGMSGAELAQLVNEACLEAVRADRVTVTEADFDSAIAIVTMGRARMSAIVSDEDKLLTAWHEAGHAVCGLVQKDAESPVSISIIPRGPAGGVTHFPANDSGYITRKQAYSRLVTGMGGMAAEQMLIGEGEFTTGPSGDLQQCSNTALAMVTQYGMGESLLVKSDAILGAAGGGADDAIQEADMLMRHALEEAKKLLSDNMVLFTNMVDALIEYETLMQSDIEALVANRSVVPSAVAPPAPRQPPPVIVLPDTVPVVLSPKEKRAKAVGELVSVARETLKPRRKRKPTSYA